MGRKQCFPVSSPVANIVKKFEQMFPGSSDFQKHDLETMFLVCSPSGIMARKQSFLVCPPSENLPGNNVF